jgi:NADH-quinone oxidoreductase subunit H
MSATLRQGRRLPAKGLTPPILVGGAIAAFVLLAVNVAIGYVILDGRLDGEWYDVRDLGLGVQELRGWLDDRNADQPGWLEWLGDHWISYAVTALLGAIGIMTFVGLSLLALIWTERRLIGRLQIRRGPNRVGPFGLLQPVADAIKLIQKEVLVPVGADQILFMLPPAIIFIPMIAAWGPVPWGGNMAYLDIHVGVLYLIAVSSLTTLAIFMAGWASNNHYALLGSMRTVAMMISYEIPLSIALLSVVLLTGSMQLSEIVAWQSDHNAWLAALLPIALITYFFSSTAELNRTPNDIAEAESEIVAGFHTEYSGMKFGLFSAVELGNALLVATLVATFFLGGWTLFGLEEWVPGYLILFGKLSAAYFVLIWLRGTLPRFRLDQLMRFAWQYLIPLSLFNLLIVAVEVSLFARWDVPALISLGLFAAFNWVAAIVLFREWARRIGYRPELEVVRRPTMTQRVGGAQAAERLGTAG